MWILQIKMFDSMLDKKVLKSAPFFLSRESNGTELKT